MADESGRSVSRRSVLGALAVAASLSGCEALQRGDDAETTEVDDDEARELAVQFAPTLYFDTDERWFPTDPRPYASDRDGERVVDGFDALNGYTERTTAGDGPPDPRVFYNVVSYQDSPLSVVQYWFYSVFDQFTTNFHWHDWEVLHVFVDTDSGDPQLYVASSHSTRVPNNEFLDPDPETTPRILSELGSHSSALSLNDVADRFQRLPVENSVADITNGTLEGLESLADTPIAYGLPRDEGGLLPFLVPELDGKPVYEDDRLPSVSRADLLPDTLTIRSLDALTSPPEDLPPRSTGTTFGHASSAESADVEYDLVSTAEVEDIAAFTGPQLSFEFAVPQFAEDAIASHISTAGTPWKQPRYENPAADITDPRHRSELADRYDAIGQPSPVNAVLAGISETVTDDDAPDGAGVTTTEPTVESVALLESEPTAVPTFGGVVAVTDAAEGDHRLTVNGAGLAPHSEPVSVGGEGPTVAGVEGEIPLTARENATKLEVDADGTDAELTRLAIDDDFGGRLYDAPLSGPDAVYVHRGGAYTTEVRDSDGEVGAFRVNPAADASDVRITEPNTGKASLATFLADIATETSDDVTTAAGLESVLTPDDTGGTDGTDATGQDGNRTDRSADTQTGPVEGLARALAAVAEAARRAAERAEVGDRGRADESLQTVSSRLDRVSSRLAEAQADLPDSIARATDRRLQQARTRTDQALNAEKL
ncbi:hypothetical protein [Halorarius litoreus]|uniref:hypothetical protein n=1 Tax=Halorarius litoreus TaxID=2962676 RepID=UPI0020CC5661|nr:hypothetical protein [Halorarius litoreus]